MSGTLSPVRPCFGGPVHPLERRARVSEYNPELMDIVWNAAFGRNYDAVSDDHGGYDFSQLLVSRRAVLDSKNFQVFYF